MLKLIAPPVKKQTIIAATEETDSESENIPENATSTPIKNKTTATTRKITPVNSRNKNYYNLHFTTTPQNQSFPTFPHTYFSNKFPTTFNFIEVFTEDKPDTCATIIQNSKNHIATLSTGHFGYIEVPITKEKPNYYQVKDINTLIHNVTHIPS